MEEVHKVDGQEVNYLLQCNNSKHRIKHQMQIMDKVLLWYKLLKVKEELKQDNLSECQVDNSNNSMRSKDPRSLHQMRETNFDE